MTTTTERIIAPPANQNINSGQGLGGLVERFLADYFEAHESVLPTPWTV